MKTKKKILITGCSSGIGKHCAMELLSQEWQVFATARKPEDLKMLADNGLEAIYLDYTDTKSIHTCFNKVIAKTNGQLDALFNNGAYGQPGAVEDLTTDVLRKQFEANFFGWHELTNLFLPIMRKQGHGRIIHCSSILGWVSAPWPLIEPGPIKTEFSKHALNAFLENIDQENTAHKERYEQELKRLSSGGGVNRFRLEPSSVYKKLDHALNAKRPKAHYGVTVPTHIMDIARRFLPTRMVDKMLLKNNS